MTLRRALQTPEGKAARRDRYLLGGHGRNSGIEAYRRSPAGTRTASLQAHNAASHSGRFCAWLSPRHEASPGQVAQGAGPSHGPGRPGEQRDCGAAAHPSPSALRRGGRVLPSPLGWPYGTTLRPASDASRSTAPVGRCGRRHREMDTDPRICRRGKIVLGRSLLHHVLRKGFFYITVGNSAQQRTAPFPGQTQLRPGHATLPQA